MDGSPFPLGRVGRAVSKLGGNAPSFNRSPRGESGYSLRRVVMALASGDWREAAFECSLSEKMRGAGYPGAPKSILVPLVGSMVYPPGAEGVIEQVETETKQAFATSVPDLGEVQALRQLTGKAMSNLDDLGGGNLVAVTQGQLLPLLRAAELFSRADAKQFPMLGPLQLPKLSSSSTMQWYAPGVSITESQPNTGVVNFAPKSAKGLTRIGNELMRAVGSAAEALIREDMIAQAARTLDAALLVGTGGTLQPQGLLNYALSANDVPALDKVTLHQAATGTNGDTYRVSDPATAVSLIEEGPDGDGPNAWMMFPRMFWALANKRSDSITTSDGLGPFLFPVTRGSMSGAVEKVLLNIPVLTSTTVPKNRTKGSSGATLTVVVLGNFRRFAICRVGALELAVSTESGFPTDETLVRFIIRCDGGPLYPSSFVVTDQLLLTV